MLLMNENCQKIINHKFELCSHKYHMVRKKKLSIYDLLSLLWVIYGRGYLQIHVSANWKIKYKYTSKVTETKEKEDE